MKDMPHPHPSVATCPHSGEDTGAVELKVSNDQVWDSMTISLPLTILLHSHGLKIILLLCDDDDEGDDEENESLPCTFLFFALVNGSELQ
jgi:hypothetical protein